MIEVIEATAKQLFIPLTVGGGIQNLDDITQLLNHGADKVSLNSSALKHPELIRQAERNLVVNVFVLLLIAFMIKTERIISVLRTVVKIN